MRQAAQQHEPLTVLAVRPEPVRPATGIYWGLHAYPEDSHNPDVARKAVGQIVDQARNEIGETSPQVTVNVVTGDPAQELINASHDASLVVVGSRGNGGLGWLLGSVSSKVAHHAACPVVIIREKGQAA
jgi:nucleotide-binding universal stress UspA family protein